jgi:phospholipid transport system substrate-binding protein
MRLRIGLVVAALLCAPAPSRASDEAAGSTDSGDAARQVVEAFHEVLLGCMKEGEVLGFSSRYERMLASLDHSFDLAFMARAAVSSAWKELDKPERAAFVDLTRRLSASRYADNFSGYGGQRFDTLDVEPAARDTILVKTLFVQPKDDDVRFDYRLRRLAAGWRVIDVQLDGMISELAIRRGQYRSMIEREGFPALVEALEEKIEKFSKP